MTSKTDDEYKFEAALNETSKKYGRYFIHDIPFLSNVNLDNKDYTCRIDENSENGCTGMLRNNQKTDINEVSCDLWWLK